ncbi:uncharacterized protein LOC116261469 [Nymphaea colorata]|nr:uncharacterized protein LOC116261469 [Nymphaea colorata]
MLCHVLRLGCTSLLGSSGPSSSILGSCPRRHKASRFLRSLQQSPGGASDKSSSTDGEEMQGQQEQQPEKLGDIMAESFGEAYATRSEEEGFGGIYGESQTFVRKERVAVSKVVQEGQPDYDDTQGSTVKETEKGRNSTEESAST